MASAEAGGDGREPVSLEFAAVLLFALFYGEANRGTRREPGAAFLLDRIPELQRAWARIEVLRRDVYRETDDGDEPVSPPDLDEYAERDWPEWPFAVLDADREATRLLAPAAEPDDIQSVSAWVVGILEGRLERAEGDERALRVLRDRLLEQTSSVAGNSDDDSERRLRLAHALQLLFQRAEELADPVAYRHLVEAERRLMRPHADHGQEPPPSPEEPPS